MNNKVNNDDAVASSSTAKPGRGRRSRRPEPVVAPRRQSLRQAKQRSNETLNNSFSKKESKSKKKVESSEDEEDEWSINDDDEDYLATVFKKLSKSTDIPDKPDPDDEEDELFQDDENDKDVYDFDQQSSIVSSRQVKDKKWLQQQQNKLKSSKTTKLEPVQHSSWGSNIYSYLATFLNTREDLDLYSKFLKCAYVNKTLDQTINDLCKPFRNLNFEGPTASLQNLMSKIDDNTTIVGLMKEIMSDRFENAAHRISQFVLIVKHPINGLQFYPKFNDILHSIDSKIVSESAFIVEVEKSESRKNIPDVDTIVVTDSFYAFVCEKLLSQSTASLQRLVLGIDENKSLIGLFVLDSWNRAGVPFNRTRIKYNTANAVEPSIVANGDAVGLKIDFVDAFFVRMGGKKEALHLITKIDSKFVVFNVISEHIFAFKKHGLSSKTPIVLEGMYSTFSEVLGEEKSSLIIPDQFYKSLLKTLHKEIQLPNCKFKKFVLLDKQTRAPLGVFFDTDVTLDIQIHDGQTVDQILSILPHSDVHELKPTKQNVMLGSLNGILVGFEIGPHKYIAKCYEIISDSIARLQPQTDKRQSVQTLFLAPSGLLTTVQFCNAETGENTYVSASLFDNVPYCKRQEQIDDYLNEIADRIFELPLQISLFDSLLRLCQHRAGGECRDDCCVFCGREFKASANVYDHEIRHVGLIRFKCHKHQMVFADMKSYKSHHDEFIDCQTESETELETTQKLLNISTSLSDCPQCDKCYDYFPQTDILRSHLDICDGVSFNARTPLDSKYDPGEALTSECFICGICGLNYSKLDILCSHMNNHLSCNVCKTRLSSIDEVSVHLRDHLLKNENVSGPGKRKILVCDICNDFYGTKVNYYYHQWNEHGVVHPPIKNDGDANEPLFKRRSKRMNELSYMATGMKKFSCKFCSAEVKVAGRDYIKHLDVKHGLTVELDTLCRICADIFETPEKLSDHLRDHHIQSGQYINAGIQSIFSCDKCTFFGHYRGVVSHSSSVHADSNPCLYECPHCPERMADRRLWRLHLEKHEENQATFTCDECQTYFKTEAALKLHLETFHGIVKQSNELKCTLCDKEFVDSHQFKAHMVEEHDGCVDRYPFSCFLCPEKFLFENELAAHQDVHGGMMQCDICQKVCKSMKAYELHRMKHFRTRIFQCTECQATFRSKLAMRRHIRVDHLNLEPERYECQICGKIVTQISMHMLIHKNARYQCEYCGKRFTKSAYYNEHVRIHKGEKPYECHICQRRFNKKSNLNVHINFHEKHRDDFGNYLEIKPRGRGHPDYDPQKTIARKNAMKKVDATCGPDVQILMENVLANSKCCDTGDLGLYIESFTEQPDTKKRKFI